MRANRHRRARRRRGSATVELALILPIVMLLVAGIVEFGRIFEVYTATNRLASQYAYSWAYCPNSCGTELTQYTTATAISNVVPQLVLANLSLTMVEFQVVDTGVIGAPVVLYLGGYYGGASTQVADLVTATVAAATYNATATTGTTQKIVVVIATYQHSLNFFSYLMNPFLGPYLKPTYTASQLTNQ